MTRNVFSYPDDDEVPYLSWFADEFSSVFVATNPFLNVCDYSSNPQVWIPDDVEKIVKQGGADKCISWQEMSQLCGFPSIAHVNRALRLTGSKRIGDEFGCSSDTEIMLEICRKRNLFVPDEGRFSSEVEPKLCHFLEKLGHDEVMVADHFGFSPRKMKSEAFLRPDDFAPPEIYAQDGSIYISIYTDYHYFLVCQTDNSKSAANPMNYFEGFFADEKTNDFWGIGKLADGNNAS